MQGDPEDDPREAFHYFFWSTCTTVCYVLGLIVIEASRRLFIILFGSGVTNFAEVVVLGDLTLLMFVLRGLFIGIEKLVRTISGSYIVSKLFKTKPAQISQDPSIPKRLSSNENENVPQHQAPLPVRKNTKARNRK